MFSLFKKSTETQNTPDEYVRTFVLNSPTPYGLGAEVAIVLRSAQNRRGAYYYISHHDFRTIKEVVELYLDQPVDLGVFWKQLREFAAGFESVIRTDAKDKYGPDYDSGHNIEANTFVYANIEHAHDMACHLLLRRVRELEEVSLDTAVSVLDTYPGTAWSEGRAAVEKKFVLLLASSLTEQSQLMSLLSGMRTYKGLMFLAIANGCVPNEEYVKAVEQHKEELRVAELRRQEERQRNSFVSAI